MDRISLTIKLDVEDYIGASCYIFYKQITGKFIMIMGALIIGFGFLMINTIAPFAWANLLFGFCLIAGVPATVCSMAKNNYTQDLKIGEATNYEFDEAGIQLTRASSQSKWVWDEVYGVTECKDWILIWGSVEGAHVIPTKVLTPSELESLRGILNAKTGSRKKLKRQRLIELINTQNSQPH